MTKLGKKEVHQVVRLTKIPSQIVYIFAIPIFFLAFTLLFRPMFLGWELREVGGDLSFNTVIAMCIILGVMTLSRVPMIITDHFCKLSWLMYGAWCVGEIVLMALFAGLFYCLMSQGIYGYFQSVGLMGLYFLLIFSCPYIMMGLWMELWRVKTKSELPDEQIIRFKDVSGKQKLAIDVHAILFIESNTNYICVHYVEGEEVKHFQVRTTMKSIETLLATYHIVRCQRAYYINPEHIKVLRRGKEGAIFAELDMVGMTPIPVSPNYYERLAAML